MEYRGPVVVEAWNSIGVLLGIAQKTSCAQIQSHAINRYRKHLFDSRRLRIELPSAEGQF